MWIRRQLLVFCWILGAVISPTFAAENRDAAAYVRQALEAELKGDSNERNALLARALQLDPDHAPARWHSGFVRVRDAWLPVAEVERAAVAAGAVAEYRKLREQCPDNEAGHVAAAQWCRKHKLPDQERLHWSAVLQRNNANRDARSRLGVREHAGRLMTGEAIEREKVAQKRFEKESTYWKAWVKERRAALEGKDTAARDQALTEIRELNDSAVVPFLEAGLPENDSAVALAVLEALGNMSEPAATECLVRAAVLAGDDEVRRSAATKLARRSWYGYVPTLLNGLQTPVEFSYTAAIFNGNAYSSAFVFEREGPAAVQRLVDVRERVFQGQARYTSTLNAIYALGQRKLEADARVRAMQGSQIRREVEQANRETEYLNHRIYAVLETTTEQKLDGRPQPWWRWWEEYNELYSTGDRPPVKTVCSLDSDCMYVVSASCFVRSTPVWTETGAVAVEKVRRGDRVLAQHPETGELAYRPVLDTTIRPPVATKRIILGDEEIVATLGHPFWVVGRGWRMTKELRVGDQLHGLAGAVEIRAIEDGVTTEAFNLVVDEFNTYFVGNSRLLVHDNRTRMPSQAVLPGFAFR